MDYTFPLFNYWAFHKLITPPPPEKETWSKQIPKKKKCVCLCVCVYIYIYTVFTCRIYNSFSEKYGKNLGILWRHFCNEIHRSDVVCIPDEKMSWSFRTEESEIFLLINGSRAIDVSGEELGAISNVKPGKTATEIWVSNHKKKFITCLIDEAH